MADCGEWLTTALPAAGRGPCVEAELTQMVAHVLGHPLWLLPLLRAMPVPTIAMVITNQSDIAYHPTPRRLCIRLA
jgi:hypothetical protein